MPARDTVLAQARRAYHALPRPLRRALNPLAAHILSLIAACGDLGDGQAPAGSGVTVAGLFSSPSGIGEGARLCADALEALGWQVERLDLAPQLGLAIPALRRPPDPMLARGPIILHLNPPLFRSGLALIGRRRRRRRMVIGYWAWELEHAPRSWRRAASGLHEVWTPSTFSAAALKPVLDVAVHVVPHPVTTRAAAPARTDFGLPEEACIFLGFASLHSNLARKNPQATIEAYAQAFPARRGDVLLVIKLDGDTVAPDLARALHAQAAACACPVRFLTEALDQTARDRLIASCDVLISLHRSEGFGLTMAEAMALGRPVVATAWSGNMDFTLSGRAALVRAMLVPVRDPQGFYDPAMRWAEPDLAEAAAWLQRLAATPALRQRLAEAGARMVLPARFAAALRETALAAGTILLQSSVAAPSVDAQAVDAQDGSAGRVAGCRGF